MCSKQLLLRNTACRTGLSEHCRISGTAAKISKEEHETFFFFFFLETGDMRCFASMSISHNCVDMRILSIWLCREIRLSSQLCLS